MECSRRTLQPYLRRFLSCRGKYRTWSEKMPLRALDRIQTVYKRIPSPWVKNLLRVSQPFRRQSVRVFQGTCILSLHCPQISRPGQQERSDGHVRRSWWSVWKSWRLVAGAGAFDIVDGKYINGSADISDVAVNITEMFFDDILIHFPGIEWCISLVELEPLAGIVDKERSSTRSMGSSLRVIPILCTFSPNEPIFEII